jgi:hypothetical protein
VSGGARTQLGAEHVVEQIGVATIYSHARSYLDCGCSVYVGMNVGTRAHAIAFVPCDPEHRPIAEQFNALLEQDPDRRRLTIQRAAELLSVAESMT